MDKLGTFKCDSAGIKISVDDPLIAGRGSEYSTIFVLDLFRQVISEASSKGQEKVDSGQ